MTKTKIISGFITLIMIINIFLPIALANSENQEENNTKNEVTNNEMSKNETQDSENEEQGKNESNNNEEQNNSTSNETNTDNNTNKEDKVDDENVIDNSVKDETSNEEEKENKAEENEITTELNLDIEQTIQNGTYKIRSALDNNMVLDIDAGSLLNYANVQIWQDTDADQQKFNITELENGYYKIEAAHSNKSLDVYGGYKSNGTNVQQYESNDSDAQSWIIKYVGDGYFTIESKCNGLNLDIDNGKMENGTNVKMYEADGNLAQKFKFEKVESLKNEPIANNAIKTIENGTYKIRAAIDNNKVVDISEASSANGANVQIWQDTDADQQMFNITHLGNGYYKIEAYHSNKSLDVYGGYKTNGTNVQQYESNDSDAQTWMLKDAGNGYYNIESKCNGLNLDIDNGSTANGTNIKVYESNGSNAQKFKFEKIDIIKKNQTIEDGTYKIRAAIDTNKVIDISESSQANGANVQIWQDVNQAQQIFDVTYLNNGYYKIEASHSSKSLDVYGGYTSNGTNVQQYDSNGSDAQQWMIKELGDGNYNIMSKCNKLNLDIDNGSTANGTNIKVYESNGSNAQKFMFEKAESVTNRKTIEDGMYKIRSGLDNNMVLDISAGSKDNNANVQIWQDTNVKQQKFHVKYLGEGYYSIKAVHSKKALDVTNASTNPGTNLQQYEFYNSDAQQWIIEDAGDGYYKIKSKCNDLYIDVKDEKTANGTNVQLYTGNTTNAQKFKFELTEAQAIDDGVYEIKSALNTNKLLDISGGSYENNANVQIWDRTDVNQQKFVFTYDSTSKKYKIKAAHSNKFLDLYCGYTTNGTNIQQYENNNSDAQKWYIEDLEDGTYRICSALNSNMVLDIYGAQTANGTNVQIYEKNGSLAQLFRFEETTIKDNSNFSGLDESKYPGFKSQLEALQNKYPNWSIKIQYTGLDWNTVINEEDKFSSGSPKSLIHESYNNEWINGTEKYDVSGQWYRASQKAIAYMMDPRNSLEEAWVFQFQDLSSSNGTREEISKMTEGTFLHTDSLIDTIISTAQEQGISPFHIVSRILQEQGNDGSGVMNGYDYLDKKVYNLFNIAVSGNTSNGILAGARYAYEKGWYSQEASIRGGAEFLKTDYISKGQSSLYYQKYNVVNKAALYDHQYMQNIRAANDEGNIMYNAYKKSNILSSHFEFVIPVYENMPSAVSPRPSN